MGKFLSLGLLAAVLLGACAPAQGGPAPGGEAGLPLAGCLLSAPSSPDRMDADCGVLSVPEDRTNPGGRTIDLRVAVIGAVSRSPQPDPLFLLAGGPGQAASEVYLLVAGAFQQVAQERDVVLIDQRGTGGSNPLECAPEAASRAELQIPAEEVIAQLQSCPARLEGDPRFYTTAALAADLDDVRAALGYERVNLYGVSYGTRAALAYLRLYPEHVRAVVLDAVVSPDFRLLLNAPRDGQRALDLLLARCQADPACAEAFPDLRAELDGLFERAEAEPIRVHLPDPVTAEPLDFPLTRDQLASVLFNLLYVPEAVTLVPLAIHTAATRDDFAPLLGLALDNDPGIYDGLFYAVTCTEDAPLISPPEAAEAAQGSVFGDMSASFLEVCAAWPQGEALAALREPLNSDTPALLLSGEADPITPPQYAEAVARQMPNSLHVVAPGMGHGLLVRGCVPRLVADFIAQGSVAGLEAACVEQIAPPPFFVDFTGPNP